LRPLAPSTLSCMVKDGPVILIGVGQRRVGRDDGAVGACPRGLRGEPIERPTGREHREHESGPSENQNQHFE